MFVRVLVIFIFICFQYAEVVSASSLQAAFIRDHQLWIKMGDEETQITTDRHVYSPKWSYDGRFIGYIDRGKDGEKSDLFIYDTVKKESYQPYGRVETDDFKWSPVKNQLAYRDRGLLNITKTVNGRPEGFENVTVGVSAFEWYPNGEEFIVSSQASIRPTGWGPIPLFRVPVDANLNPDKVKPLYTIQTKEQDLFAIDADYFKWSPDGKWVSFLAIPTASWSNDSNTLCVLSSEGNDFQVVGKMLWYKDWIKWAPRANQLAYISGEGRFFVENKKTTIADIPISRQQKEYTPAGYVDLDLEWYSPDTVIVARAKENKEWNEGPVPTMFTALYTINIKTAEQTRITFPKENELDEAPEVIGPALTWFRHKGNVHSGDVWIRDGLNGESEVWIKQVDSAPSFFQQPFINIL
ncbi:translocation protein TolB [Rossellomorea sp. AcN35-11]|nr:translocation protein TolB [Rossellomorea aquimaris]WJV29701.1 translocation protein TolB [Rossellomorea sp. AcN35-11]